MSDLDLLAYQGDVLTVFSTKVWRDVTVLLRLILLDGCIAQFG